ncbi:MAG: YDG domain-containing protein, partial [Kiritimatiellae bacterium]|nr:YDG domain-containing protein [Kiritimatiellia bacterium]
YYNSKHVGTSKTMTPDTTVKVTDGNSGNNYSYTYTPANVGEITALALTITGQANSKTYDGTTNSATAASITSGSVQAGDSAPTWTQYYNSKHVGTAKTMTPDATVKVTDGNSGNNYSYTYTPANVGEITALALTITGQANSKTYDGTTNSATAAAITVGSLQGSDTATWTQYYNSKHVGTAKTMTPDATVKVIDGNSGNNYSYTYTPANVGEITALALTITGQANSKTYDGTTNSATTAAITVGSLQGSDTANWTQYYDTKHAGTGKTMTPDTTVKVADGNSGNNYSYTYTPANVGEITALALTITGQANSKTYDGTTNSAAAATITVGSLQGSDTATWTQYYDTKHVGTSKTMTPDTTVKVTDGNSGNNYSYTYTPANVGEITALALTITGQANSKSYDGTTNSATAAAITVGSLQGSDTATWTQYYDSKHVGTGKTMTPDTTVKVTDGNSGNNYSYTYTPANAGEITALALTITGQANSKTYDGTTNSATAASITLGSVQAGDSAPTWTQYYNSKHVGTSKTMTPDATVKVTDGNSGNNYSYTYTPANVGEITALALTITGQANSRTYDGTTNSATAAAITVGSLQGSDTATWTQYYDSKHVGAGKTMTPDTTVKVTDGNSGNNYSYTYTPANVGEITALALTITGQANSKTYDGTTNSATAASITVGSVQAGDSAPTWTQYYNSKHVGTSKTMTPDTTVKVTDGNSGNNYSYTYTPANVGEITALALTITGQANSKTYDGTTNSATAASITSGSVQAGDSAPTWTQYYNSKHVGTAKTMTPDATVKVTDGNSGNNYSYTYTPANVGEITALALTITGQANSKTYDGTTNSATAASITSGSVQAGDSAPTWTQYYNSKHVGTAKTMTPDTTVKV